MQLLINALIAGSLGALIAVGLALVYGVLGVFNMALGQMAIVGGLLVWWFMAVCGFPFAFAALFSLLCSTALAFGSFLLFVKPFYRRHRFLPLITTLALSIILDGAILLLFGETPKSIDIGLTRTVSFFGGTFSLAQLFLIGLTLVCLGCLTWVLAATSLGRKIRATVMHPEAAESLGMPSGALHMSIFVMSSLLAAAAGTFLGIDQNISPTFGFPMTIKAYAAVIAGGKGSIRGAIIAAYAIALLEQLAIGIPWLGGSFIPAGYQSAVALFLIIAVLLYKPEGIFGSLSRRS